MKICIFNQKGFVDEKKWAWKCLRKKVYTGEGILTLFNRKYKWSQLALMYVSNFISFTNPIGGENIRKKNLEATGGLAASIRLPEVL